MHIFMIIFYLKENIKKFKYKSKIEKNKHADGILSLILSDVINS